MGTSCTGDFAHPFVRTCPCNDHDAFHTLFVRTDVFSSQFNLSESLIEKKNRFSQVIAPNGL